MTADLFGMGANAGFVVAAYSVNAVIVCGYAISLWRAARRRRAAPPSH